MIRKAFREWNPIARRARVEPGYAAIWWRAELKRKERNRDSRLPMPALRTIASLFGWGHDQYSRRASPEMRLRWFSSEQAQRATRERNALIAETPAGMQCSAHGTKPYTGSLSPGCEVCQTGDWGCNLINRRCTRDCFFCKRFHTMAVECDPETDGRVLSSATQHVQMIESFGVRGVGFSGGEPLMVPERLVEHIEAIRREHGRAIYLWMYTNGDLVTREIMLRLRDAGLDEIRFNLAARAYDASPVEIAREVIPTVTVEIPTIPEHRQKLEGMIRELETIGVDYLNLHQLYVSAENWSALCRRDYRVDCSTEMTVYESEICALELLAFGLETQSKLPISYCSHAYKKRFQVRGRRTRAARATLEGHQEITQAGFIRCLSVSGTALVMSALVQRLTASDASASRWRQAERGGPVLIHSSLIPVVPWETARATVEYIDPDVGLLEEGGGYERRNLQAKHRPVEVFAGLGREEVEGIENLPKTADYERLAVGLPDIL